jgi:ubiquinone/menaquinone biosynthesis C-methylase UbiE
MPVHDAAARGFGRGADEYERARPGYPDAAIAFLQTEFDLCPGRVVLDLAAGTGKLTRALATTGAELVAVEPVAAMGQRLIQAVPEARLLYGTAEKLPLDDESVDAVTVAQAFHWFDAKAALREIHRVLRPGGGLAAIWNVRDESHDWVHQFTEILIAGSDGAPYRRDYTSDYWAQIFAVSGLYTPLESRRFPHEQATTPEMVVERAASTSFVSILPDDRRQALLDDVRRLLDEHPDLVGRDQFNFPHETDVFWCHRLD